MARVTFKKQPLERFRTAPDYEVKLDGRRVASLAPISAHDGSLYYWSTRFGGWRNTSAEKDFRPLEEAKAQVKAHILAMVAQGATGEI